MKALQSLIKKLGKQDRERKVLLGLVDYFIRTAKPVGSNTLKEADFADLSAATIRNYFAHLEEEGYLIQQHSSGGRIPTDKAFRLYANDCFEQIDSAKIHTPHLQESLSQKETRAIAALLQRAAEKLTAETNTAVFLSAPRFEHDFIIGIKLLAIDSHRCLCVLITDFGEVKTEVLYVDNKLSAFSSKRIEAYFYWRLTGQQKPENLSKEEEDLAQKLYNELLVRYIVSYSQFNEEEIYRTGFSSLLSYPELQDPTLLANSLSLFENTHGMRLLLKECSKHKNLKFWIGDDLLAYSSKANPGCAVIAIPYYVNNQPVGAIGLLGPLRLPYGNLFTTLHQFSQEISEALTKNLYKFKISLRQPKTDEISVKTRNSLFITDTAPPLLEDKRSSDKPQASAQKQDPSKHPARRK